MSRIEQNFFEVLLAQLQAQCLMTTCAVSAVLLHQRSKRTISVYEFTKITIQAVKQRYNTLFTKTTFSGRKSVIESFPACN